MAEDLYQILGVARDADAKVIRTAYRKLAKQNHPDLHPGDARAEERFKAIASAYDLLSDPQKRAAYDRGEIDASGAPRADAGFYRSQGDGAAGAKYHRGPGFAGAPGGGGLDDAELGDILSELFGAGAGGHGSGRAGGPRRGLDQNYRLQVPFLVAVAGGSQRLVMPDGSSLEVKVPAGIETGQVLRLRGRGSPGRAGGPAGDALIAIEVAPHDFFRREGADILLDLPVSLHEAVLGARVSVPTPTGAVLLTVPKGADTGTRLRLRGRGVAAHGDKPAGDMHVTLQVRIGTADPALAEFLAAHPAPAGTDIRAGLNEPVP